MRHIYKSQHPSDTPSGKKGTKKRIETKGEMTAELRVKKEKAARIRVRPKSKSERVDRDQR